MNIDWFEILNRLFENLLRGTGDFLLRFIPAIVIFIIGWIVAVLIGDLEYFPIPKLHPNA